MRIRKIVSRVNALAGPQSRFIIHLDCGHNISLRQVTQVSTWVCPACPNVAQEKSATQLWKEAGEP